MSNIKIPISELNFSFSRSSGAGGQNVNKVNSKVTMDWDPDLTEACNASVVERFRKKYSQYVLSDGKVQITCQTSRSQKANMDECINKLEAMISDAAIPPKPRKATKPKRSAVLKRLDSKRKDSNKKRDRRQNHE